MESKKKKVPLALSVFVLVLNSQFAIANKGDSARKHQGDSICRKQLDSIRSLKTEGRLVNSPELQRLEGEIRSKVQNLIGDDITLPIKTKLNWLPAAKIYFESYRYKAIQLSVAFDEQAAVFAFQKLLPNETITKCFRNLEIFKP